MARSSVKPKASAIWSEQTEKLRKRFPLFDTSLDFEQGKMGEIVSRLRQKSATRHGLLEMI